MYKSEDVEQLIGLLTRNQVLFEEIGPDGVHPTLNISSEEYKALTRMFGDGNQFLNFRTDIAPPEHAPLKLARYKRFLFLQSKAATKFHQLSRDKVSHSDNEKRFIDVSEEDYNIIQEFQSGDLLCGLQIRQAVEV